MTPVPMERRLPDEAPAAMASGRQPRMKAKEVMTIGRSRSREASTAASRIESPCLRFRIANSMMRMAFLAASAISVSRPIWK